MLSLSQLSPHQTLQKYWGYPDFRPNQLDIITAILNYQDSLAILPTGGGKSICFQVPGLILPGITLAVSPLISLMKDQVDQLLRRQISAIYLDSSLSVGQMKLELQNISQNKYKFVYVSPERLLNRQFRQLFKTHPQLLSFVAIDEAHCISLWGHDFRDSFLHIKDFLRELTIRPHLAAFTATTTPTCTQDIIKFLDFKNPRIFSQSFARDNLHLFVSSCPTLSSKKLRLLRLLKKHHLQSGIIYCSTRAATTQLANWLNRLQIFPPNQPVLAYHGALPKEERSQIQEQFITDRSPLIVATNAFGMGMDKPNIRFVIHFQISANIENYYQEIGRAGRDGKRGDCYALIHEQDWQINKSFIDLLNLNDPQITKQRQKLLLNKLKQIQKFVTLKTSTLVPRQSLCRQNFILQYFQPELDSSTLQACGRCDLCTQTQLSQPLPDEEKHLHFLDLIRTKIAHHLDPDLKPQLLFPIHLLHYLALLKPTTLTQLSSLPGFGHGFLREPAYHLPFLKYFQKLPPVSPP